MGVVLLLSGEGKQEPRRESNLGLDYRLVGFSSVLYKLEMKSLFDDLMRVDVLLELRVQLPMAVAPCNDCCLCWVFSPLNSVHL
jgi:hypothetical protein